MAAVRPLTASVVVISLAAAACGGCGAKNVVVQTGTRPTHAVVAVASAIEEQGLRVRPRAYADQLGRIGVPAAVRDTARGDIVGYVVSDKNLVAGPEAESYLILATIFSSAEAADRALAVAPRWVPPSTSSNPTAQFQQDNVVTYGAVNTHAGLRELRAALDELANGR